MQLELKKLFHKLSKQFFIFLRYCESVTNFLNWNIETAATQSDDQKFRFDTKQLEVVVHMLCHFENQQPNLLLRLGACICVVL